ncbi:hypothetical protein COLO4_10896 [Corchorus olitorius]|uniref:Uncharacterized protein n=1 Tax=Corchorus olitorius TaxID=93759 RepID=A0A1R3K6J4_9ROSI|nr:hypothetical protein COLO4_10896 [Corchorus olitorius]
MARAQLTSMSRAQLTSSLVKGERIVRSVLTARLRVLKNARVGPFIE